VTRKILVIEDNREIADLVALHLRDMGCADPHVFEVEAWVLGDKGAGAR